jgi:hypothetical protein
VRKCEVWSHTPIMAISSPRCAMKDRPRQAAGTLTFDNGLL